MAGEHTHNRCFVEYNHLQGRGNNYEKHYTKHEKYLEEVEEHDLWLCSVSVLFFVLFVCCVASS